MTAAEFRAWLERRGWNYTQAAPHLAADHTEVMRWAKGERKVPRRIVRIIELMGESNQSKDPKRKPDRLHKAIISLVARPLRNGESLPGDLPYDLADAGDWGFCVRVYGSRPRTRVFTLRIEEKSTP